MKERFKFIKPKSSFKYDKEHLPYVLRFNEIGSKSWTGKLKDEIGLEYGDITIRDNLIDKIKKHLVISQDEYCYYCGRSFYIFGPSPSHLSYIHIDHFLPRNAENKKYGKYAFEPNNLVLACFICNGFTVKGNKDFCATPDAPYESMEFLIVHPFLENIEEHLKINLTNGVAEIISDDIKKADLMITTFGINDENMIFDRLANINALKDALPDKEEEKVDELLNSISVSGITSSI